MTQAIIPELQPIADALLDASARLATQQQQYATLQQTDAALAQKYGVDEALIPQLRATIAAQIQPPLFTPTVYASLQKRTDWSRGTDVAGLSGSVIVSPPAADGSVLFTFTPSSAFNNDYNYVNLESGTRDARASKYLDITEFEIADDAIPFCEEVETNFEHTLDGLQYNGGISPLFNADKMRNPVTGAVTNTVKSNVWRWYDITPGRAGWYELPEIPFDRAMFGTGKRVRIVSEFARIDNTMVHEAATINGTRYAINRKSIAKPVPSWGPHKQKGFQIDTTKIPHPVGVKVWDMECRVL